MFPTSTRFIGEFSKFLPLELKLFSCEALAKLSEKQDKPAESWLQRWEFSVQCETSWVMIWCGAQREVSSQHYDQKMNQKYFKTTSSKPDRRFILSSRLSVPKKKKKTWQHKHDTRDPKGHQQSPQRRRTETKILDLKKKNRSPTHTAIFQQHFYFLQ